MTHNNYAIFEMESEAANALYRSHTHDNHFPFKKIIFPDLNWNEKLNFLSLYWNIGKLHRIDKMF